MALVSREHGVRVRSRAVGIDRAGRRRRSHAPNFLDMLPNSPGEEAKKAAAIARYDEAFAGLDPEKFENESSGEELAPASTIEDEVEAIDEMLEGKDEKFNKLKY